MGKARVFKKVAGAAPLPQVKVVENNPEKAVKLGEAEQAVTDIAANADAIKEALNSAQEAQANAVEGVDQLAAAPVPNMEENVEEKEKQNTNPDNNPKPEAEKQADGAFKMSYTLDAKNGFTGRSYFIGSQAKEIRTVEMSKVLPLHVQQDIMRKMAASGGMQPKGICSPEELISQLQEQGVNSLDKFVTAMAELETQATLANAEMAKTAAQQKPLKAVNESEEKTPKTGKGNEPIKSVKEEKETSIAKETKAPKSAIPSYMARAYKGKVGGEPLVSIDRKSSVDKEVLLLRERVAALRKKAADLETDRDTAKAEAKAEKERADGLEKDTKKKDTADKIHSMVEELEASGVITEEKEAEVISLLTKIDEKSLSSVVSLLKLVGEKGEKAGAMGMEDGMAMGMPELPKPIGPKKAFGIPHMVVNPEDTSINGENPFDM